MNRSRASLDLIWIASIVGFGNHFAWLGLELEALESIKSRIASFSLCDSIFIRSKLDASLQRECRIAGW